MKLAVFCLSLFLLACPGIPDEPVQQEPAPDAPAPAPGWQLGIVAIGDTGTGEAMQNRVAKGIEDFCRLNPCDTGLLLGDNIYEVGVSSETDPQWQSKFEKPYSKLDFTFHPVLGNHDAVKCWRCQVNYKSKRWLMLGEYYQYTKEDVAFFALHTNLFGKNQSEWLEKALKESQEGWKIVYGHHPVRSYGSHGDTKGLVKALLPLMQRHRVDFYLAGHDHDLQLIERDDLRYVVSGSGAKLRGTGKGNGTVFAKSSYGFVHLLISAKNATVSFVDHAGGVLYQRQYEKSDEAP